MTYYKNEDKHNEVFRVSEDGTICKRVVSTGKVDGELRTVFKYYNKGQMRYHTLDSMNKLEEVSPGEVGTHEQPIGEV